MQSKLLLPPVIFIIILSVNIILSAVLSAISFKRKKEAGDKMNTAYACGENFSGHLIQPDYSQFFPFAFFFMILHVVALMIATVPKEGAGVFSIAVVYIMGAIIGLVILLRK